MTRIVLHIDRLVLRGIDQGDAKNVAAGMQKELQRLIAQPDGARTMVDGGDRRFLTAGSARLGADNSGRATGAAIARQIFRGNKP